MDTSAIDYGIPNEATWEKITCRRVACRIESFSFRNNCEDVHREEKGGRTFVGKRNQEVQGKIRNIKIRGKWVLQDEIAEQGAYRYLNIIGQTAYKIVVG